MKNIKISFIILLLVFSNIHCAESKQIVETRGGRVKVMKFDDGTWGLSVNGKPFFIKGVIFTPVKIGESPGESTMRDWMLYDDNGNGKNDIAFETWVDKNKNNKKDSDEEVSGDFQLLSQMGCNTIRLYHVASNNNILGAIYKTGQSTELQFSHPVNKELLRKLHKDYGIMVMMGNFLGSWTIGSGAAWEEGTDYTNPKHLENIKRSVRAMVMDNKDEPYVLMWLLGNENNIADWSRCNAKEKPAEYAKLVGELVDMIHKLDPEHPVAVCDGDNFATLREYAKYAPNIDAMAYNSYRGEYGFGNIWKMVKRTLDRPVFISEFGMFAYDINVREDEELQLKVIKGCWRDIVLNSAGAYSPAKKYSGNSIGGIVFDWADRWYMDGTPREHNPGTRRSELSPDNILHEEWFGLVSLGNGSSSLMRQPRKAYYYLKDVWNRTKLIY